mmetsp:Transcript_71425/g.209713  ORF Transcript_71425/g.209713 Transcript_71425/m.209713 type:complete len:223 (-) Transcript_71425:1914-2582(-)
MWIDRYHSSSGQARKRHQTCRVRTGLSSSPLTASAPGMLPPECCLPGSRRAGSEPPWLSQHQLHSTSSENSSFAGRPTERATTCRGLSMHLGGFFAPFARQPLATWQRVDIRCSRQTSDIWRILRSSWIAASFSLAASQTWWKGPLAVTRDGIFVARSQRTCSAALMSSLRCLAQASPGPESGSRESRPCLPSTLQKSCVGRGITARFRMGSSSGACANGQP